MFELVLMTCAGIAGVAATAIVVVLAIVLIKELLYD